MARVGPQRHRKKKSIYIITSGQKSGLPNKCDLGAKIQPMLQDTVKMLATAELHVGCVPAGRAASGTQHRNAAPKQ